MRTLVLVGGISDHSYMKDQIKESNLSKEIECYYPNIIEIDYQHILDKYAVCFKSLGDPLRLMLTPFGREAQTYVEKSLQMIQHKYTHIDLMSHSQGSWMTMKCNVEVKNYFCIANPIGFSGIIGRTAVHLNIGKPKIRAKRFYNIFSSKDLVSCFQPRDQKWDVGKAVSKYIDTETGHGLKDYCDVLDKDYLTIFH